MAYILQQQAATMIGVTINTLLRWSRQGVGPARLKIGPKLVRYDLDEVTAWVATRNTKIPECITRPNGTKEWLVDGVRHRVDGPAVIHPDGSQEWMFYGKRHRLNGPAVIGANGSQHWGVNGKYHRLDGPAAIWPDGSQEWFVDGKYHRLDGPAVMCANGLEHWYFDGKYHRLDGPAVIRADGSQAWWVNGKDITDNALETINRLSLPNWREWTDAQKLYFRLALT